MMERMRASETCPIISWILGLTEGSAAGGRADVRPPGDTDSDSNARSLRDVFMTNSGCRYGNKRAGPNEGVNAEAEERTGSAEL